MISPSRQSSEIVIIGGGIVGCTTAYFLTASGEHSVSVIEAEGIASGASGYSAGILTPYSGSNDPGLLSLSPSALAIHTHLAENLPEVTGIDHGYDLKPYLRCAFGETGFIEAQSFKVEREKEGHLAEWLSGDEAREVCDWLSDEVEGACATSIEPTLDSRKLTQSAFKAAGMSGASLVEERAVGLTSSGGRVTGVELADGSSVSADVVVLAMGPWSGIANQWIDVEIPVAPQKGELLYMHHPVEATSAVNDDKPSAGMHNMDDGGVILPRRLSRTVLGATKQERGFDREPSDYAREFILPRVSRLSSRVTIDSVTDHTACLRPMPIDGKPFVGPAPGWDDVYIAAGHWSEGIHYGPLTGKWLADAITVGSSEYDISPISTDRLR